MLQLLQAPQLLKEMGERGRKLARKRFDTSITARQMLAQYQAIVTTGFPLLDELAGQGEGTERACEESI